MIKLPQSLAEKQLDAWAKCENIEIPNCLEKFFTNEADKSTQGQYRRLCGINYGNIDQDWADALTGKRLADENAEFAMCLAVDDKEFNIILEVKTNEHVEYYGSNLDYGGRHYSPGLIPDRSGDGMVKPHYGLMSVVVDHLCVNWYALSTESLPYLFSAPEFLLRNSPGLIRHHSVPAIKPLDPSDPFNESIVRGLKFPIVGYNRKVLQMLLNDGIDNLELSIQFGANMADKYFHDAMFSPVMVLRQKTNGFDGEDDSGDDCTFLDYAGACPPICPNGNG